MKHLGSGLQYETPRQIDPSLLNPIDRNRYAPLGTIGFDVWNCYEVSALRDDGIPVVGILRLLYSSFSKKIIESKSLKLYLNSFNMVKLGTTDEDVLKAIEQAVTIDLREALLYAVYVKTYPLFERGELTPINYVSPPLFCMHSDLLRSNCKVTNQPDWGDVYVVSSFEISEDDLNRHVLTYRDKNHFHEEVCERIFNHYHAEGERLLVTCLYTRRGGIDINPIRATSEHLLEYVNVHNLDFLQKKMPRQ